MRIEGYVIDSENERAVREREKRENEWGEGLRAHGVVCNIRNNHDTAIY